MNGLVYQIIKNMYSKVSLQVDVGVGLTKTFNSHIGVRQGDNLSPTLFNIFVNDIPDIFDGQCDSVHLTGRYINCLLYADDLVLLSETSNGLQRAMSKLQDYCDKWGLTVNALKTKALVINPRGKGSPNLYLDGNTVEVVDKVTYLGLVLDKDANFKSCLKSMYQKGLKVFFKLKKMLSPLPSIDTCLHLFEHMIKPVLLYGSELWAPILFGIRNNKLVNSENLESFTKTPD